ncbi:GNAT family N-acetyltransferase [Flavobacterium sp. CYK-55]|uniref:GNAT family N-acetyltransferase n=1 Tax=Flavobacterium sp. CYK-55 TaxID=2835529 RepID=UPI001BCD44C8|nr:GNAT family N-acetyltransferase [Flavobacterium sp. CYK-55]MBS7786976.1 GNAT family N-acetyltransferase [Flavobacterium sp. CYK-55]
MQTQNISIDALAFKQLDFSGLEMLISWAKEEGWNPGPEDAKAFWAADPEGYYGFFHYGELIAGGALISYNRAYGFMGLFIVKPNYRSQGIGRKLWYLRRDTLLKRLNPEAPIGMDGVVAMQNFYAQGGFKMAYTEERYERLGERFSLSTKVQKAMKDDFDNIAEYDQNCFLFERNSFLKSWLNMNLSEVFVYKNEGKIVGYAVIRKADIGHKIGPLFADDAQIAEELYLACLNARPYEAVFIDVPVNNPQAILMLQKYHAKYVFECGRMYYKTAPNLPINRIFGVTSFELG